MCRRYAAVDVLNCTAEPAPRWACDWFRAVSSMPWLIIPRGTMSDPNIYVTFPNAVNHTRWIWHTGMFMYPSALAMVTLQRRQASALPFTDLGYFLYSRCYHLPQKNKGFVVSLKRYCLQGQNRPQFKQNVRRSYQEISISYCSNLNSKWEYVGLSHEKMM